VSPLTRAPWEARPNSTGASSKAPPRPRPLNSATASRNLTPGGQVPAPESSRRISDQGSARSLHEVRSTSALNPRSNSAQKQRHADHCARSQEACLAAESQRHQDVFLKRVAAKENRRKLDSQHRTPRTPSSPASTVNYENWDSSPVKLVRSNATEVEARCRSQSPLMRSVGHMGSGGLGVSRGGQKVKGQSTGSRVLRPHSHDESVGSRDEMSACGSITMLGSRSRVGLVRSRAPFGSSETRNLVRLVREPAEEMWTEAEEIPTNRSSGKRAPPFGAGSARGLLPASVSGALAPNRRYSQTPLFEPALSTKKAEPVRDFSAALARYELTLQPGAALPCFKSDEQMIAEISPRLAVTQGSQRSRAPPASESRVRLRATPGRRDARGCVARMPHIEPFPLWPLADESDVFGDGTHITREEIERYRPERATSFSPPRPRWRPPTDFSSYTMANLSGPQVLPLGVLAEPLQFPKVKEEEQPWEPPPLPVAPEREQPTWRSALGSITGVPSPRHSMSTLRLAPAPLDEALGPWAAWSDSVPEQAKLGAWELFDSYRSATDLPTILSAFAQMYAQALLAPRLVRGERVIVADGCPPPWTGTCQSWRFPYEPIRVLLGGHWVAKRLWARLDARAARPEYAGWQLGRKVVVVGAGPAGLRTAIELRLLGAQVVVLEECDEFTRKSQVSLWSWCAEELNALGATCMSLTDEGFGAADVLSASVSEIQTLLLKTALLLGVQVVFGVTYCGLEWSGGNWGEWAVSVCRPNNVTLSPLGDMYCEEVLPAAVAGVAVVVGAGGGSCAVGRTVGLGTAPVDHPFSDTFAVVCTRTFKMLPKVRCHMGSQRRRSSWSGKATWTYGLEEQTRLDECKSLYCSRRQQSDRQPQEDHAAERSFHLTRQLHTALFERLKRETGLTVDAVFCVRSAAVQHFTITVPRSTLRDMKVLRPADKGGRDHVDYTALENLVRVVSSFHFDGAPVAREGQPLYDGARPLLHSFSDMRQAVEGLTLVSPPPQVRVGGHHLLAVLVGDALMESFWPEGLGVARSFSSALDAAFVVAHWVTGLDASSVRHMYAAITKNLQRLSSQHGNRALCDGETRFALATSSRYRGGLPRSSSLGGL